MATELGGTPQENPVAGDATKAELAGALQALEAATPDGAGTILTQVAEIYRRSEDATRRDEIVAAIALWIARVFEFQPAKADAFLAEARRILTPYGVELPEPPFEKTTVAGTPAAAPAAAAPAPAQTFAERIVEKLTGRLDGATKIIATRLVSFAAEGKSKAFTARFENRVLGTNLAVLDRYESALTLPEKYFDFDQRFKIASSLFPSANLVGSDGDALVGSMPVGRLAWVLGTDKDATAGYADLFSEEEALEFARAQAGDAMPEGTIADDATGLEGLGDLGELGSIGLDASALGGGFGGLNYVSAPAAGAAPAIGAASGAGALPSFGAPKLAAALAKLPAPALKAIQAGDARGLNLALGGNIAPARIDAILRSPAIAALRIESPVSGGGLGGLSHLALGFQSMAATDARSLATRSLDRLSFGGPSHGGGIGYVASPSSTYMPSLGLGAMRAPSMGMTMPAAQSGALASHLMPGVARTMGLDTRPSAASAAYAPAAQLRGMTGPSFHPSFGAAPAASGTATLPAYAISTDTFGVPRFRGAAQLPAAAMRGFEGLDLSGSVVMGGSRAAAPTMAPGASRPVSMGRGFGYTQDDFGITRIESSQRMAPQLMGAMGGGMDMRAVGLGAGAPQSFNLGHDFSGMTSMPQMRSGAIERFAAAAMPSMGPAYAPTQLGGLDLGGMMRASALQGGSARPLAMGPVDYAFPAPAPMSGFDALGGDAALMANAPSFGMLAPQMGQAQPQMLQPKPQSPSIAGGAPRLRAPDFRSMAGRPMGAAPRMASSFPAGFRFPSMPNMPSAPSGVSMAPRSFAGMSMADLALGQAPSAPRPAALEKYYAAMQSPGLALGGISQFSLPSFGPAPRAQRMASMAPIQGFDYSPLALARLSGASFGRAPQMEALRYQLPQTAPGVSSYDAGGFAPAGRMGSVAMQPARSSSMADARYDRIGRGLAGVQANYSGAMMWQGGMRAATAPSMSMPSFAPSSVNYALPQMSGFAAPQQAMPGAPALQPAPSLGSQPTPYAAAAPWRALRPSTPRLQGMYTAPMQAPTSFAGDPLGLAQQGGFEAHHAPTMLSPRYESLGLDAPIAPVVHAARSRSPMSTSAPYRQMAQRFGRLRGDRVDALTAQQLEPATGPIPEYVRLVRGPEADLATQQLGTPAFAAGGNVVLSQGVEPSTPRGMRIMAHEVRHAQSPRQPIHRFIDKLDMPGEGEARQVEQRAARLTPPAPDGVVFGLVPKTVRGHFADRFALDGWTHGDMRYSAGALDAGVALRSSTRSLDLGIEHEFIRFPGDITNVPVASMPVDMGSQLANHSMIQAKTTPDARKMGLVFQPRSYEVPLGGMLWGRPGSGRAQAGPVQVKEVSFPHRFVAVDPRRIEGALEVEGAKGAVVPGSYRLEGGRSAAGGRPGPFADAAPRSVRQVPGAVHAERSGVRISGEFAERSTSVSSAGTFTGDAMRAPAFSKIASGAETLPQVPAFLEATGLDVERAATIVTRNRRMADQARSSYVRRGGLPNASEWALSVDVDAASAAPALAGSTSESGMMLSFRRTGGGAPTEMVETDSALGNRVRAIRGQPLSGPTLDFMERFFNRDLKSVRVAESPEAAAVAHETRSEALTDGNTVYVGRPKSEDDKLASIGHEIEHVISHQRAAQSERPSAAAQASQLHKAATQRQAAADERRAKETERKILALLRREPKERRAPKLGMTHTGSDRAIEKAAERADEKAPVQKKAAADTSIMQNEKSGSSLPKPWEAMFPRPPARDLSPLIYSVWNKIKKDLAIEMERRSGGF